jgi:hypothetical protein
MDRPRPTRAALTSMQTGSWSSPTLIRLWGRLSRDAKQEEESRDVQSLEAPKSDTSMCNEAQIAGCVVPVILSECPVSKNRRRLELEAKTVRPTGSATH